MLFDINTVIFAYNYTVYISSAYIFINILVQITSEDVKHSGSTSFSLSLTLSLQITYAPTHRDEQIYKYNRQ